MTNLLKKNLLLHENFNGKISINIDSLNDIKIFDKAIINLEFINGELKLDNTILISEKIGNFNLLESYIKKEADDQIVLKSKFFFEIINQKNFFKKFQIKKINQINISNIYLEVDKNLENKRFGINKFIVNSKIKDKSLVNTIDLSNNTNQIDINNIKNWIELKIFLNQLFSEIN